MGRRSGTCRQHIVRKEPSVGYGPPAPPRAIHCCRRAGLCQCGGAVGRCCGWSDCSGTPVERRRRGGHLRSCGRAQGTRLIPLLAAAGRRGLAESGWSANWFGPEAVRPVAFLRRRRRSPRTSCPRCWGWRRCSCWSRADGGVVGRPDGPLRQSLVTTVLDGIVSALAFSILVYIAGFGDMSSRVLPRSGQHRRARRVLGDRTRSRGRRGTHGRGLPAGSPISCELPPADGRHRAHRRVRPDGHLLPKRG